jgi:membrane-associated phospholipid phosphatase
VTTLFHIRLDSSSTAARARADDRLSDPLDEVPERDWRGTADLYVPRPVLCCMRGLGELAVVSELPTVVVDLFGLLTQLGDPWFLLGALALLYTVGDRFGVDRRTVGFVFATAFVALGVTLALKSAFALPRPPGALEDGYGFPSGHALGATAVWVTAALVLDVGQRRTRLALAGSVVPLVALSRVVIGVHYVVDVVVGFVVGVAVIGVAFAVGPRRDDGTFSHAATERVFVVAGVAAVAAFAVSATSDTFLTVGAVFGGWAGWRLVEPVVTVDSSAPMSSSRGTAVTAVGLPVVLAGLLAVTAVAEATAVPGLLAVAGAGVCVAVLFALPRAAQRLSRHG